MSEFTSMERERKPRGNWSHQAEFTLSLIGFAVGLGNLWRFPYLCMRNGGGAFLIPYFTFVVLCGIPLFFLELCIGQFSSLSPLSVWIVCPLFKGVGWSMQIVSILGAVYYNVIIAWALYYFGVSLQSDVPWRSCDNEWNTVNCTVIGNIHLNQSNNSHRINGTGTGQMSSAEEFWNNRVLGLSEGIEWLGPIKWDLALSMLAAWILIYLCVCKGIKSSGKVVYVTATLPYILLTILLIRGATLPGSLQGIRFYIIPDWHRLREFKVWTDACLQVFYSFGPAWGGLITMSSYNKFHHNCLRDAVLVCFTCAGSSVFAGFAIFSTLGYMAYATGQEVENVVTAGPGLAFIAYPEAISHLPVSPVWAALFFLTLTTVGVDTQFASIETITSSFMDEFPQLRKQKYLVISVTCLAMFLLSLPFVTKGGMYLFQVIDWYAFSYVLMVISLAECVVLCYVYGIGRFYCDITLMLKRTPSIIWAIFWCGITPVILIGMLVVSALRMVPVTYGEYKYPSWAIVLGWMLAMASIVPIPIVAVYNLSITKGSFRKRMTSLIRPANNWGSRVEEFKLNYKYGTEDAAWAHRMNIFAMLRSVSPGPESDSKDSIYLKTKV